MKKIYLLLCLAIFSTAVCTHAQVVLSENFESVTLPTLPAGWTQSHTGGGDGWVSNKGPVRWQGYDVLPHSKYALIDDARHYRNDPATLTSPTFSLVGVTNPHLSFEMMYLESSPIIGWPGEKAWVEISTDGGMSYTPLDTLHMVAVWLPRFIDLSGITPTANCKLRFGYRDQPGLYGGGLAGIAIDNILVYSPTATDMGMTTVAPDEGIVESYVNTGDSVIFIGKVANMGTSSIPSFTISWQVGSSAPVSQYFSAATAAFGWNGYTAFSIAYHPTGTGPQTVKLWVTATGDTNPLNDTLRTVITGVAPNVPIKRMFIEEMTGAWCTWCPRGIVFMDSIWHADSTKVNIACVHSKIGQDAMVNDNPCSRSYDTFTVGIGGGGYPSAIIDRRLNSAVELIFDTYGQNKKMFGFANMGVSRTIMGSSLVAKATIKPEMELSGDYRLELIVTEEDVTGTDVLYHQGNAYSGSSTTMVGGGYDFNALPPIIPAGDIKFAFVARYTIPYNLNTEPNGVPGSLPSSMHAGSYYTYTFSSITIPANWNPAKLRCIALLIDNNPQSANYGYVLNSVKHTDPQLNAPGIVANGAHASASSYLYPNPASNVVNVSFELPEAADVAVSVYDVTGRKMGSTPITNMLPGTREVMMPINALPAGVYNVVLNAGSERISRTLSVVK